MVVRAYHAVAFDAAFAAAAVAVAAAVVVVASVSFFPYQLAVESPFAVDDETSFVDLVPSFVVALLLVVAAAAT